MTKLLIAALIVCVAACTPEQVATLESVTGVDFTPTNGVFTGFLPFDPSEIWLLQIFQVINPGTT